MVFYSLQGLGNSIINFPVLNCLRQHYDVRAVAFKNGSSAFFRAFHSRVSEIESRFDLLAVAYSSSESNSFASYPTWRRELSSTLLSHAKRKFLLRPRKNYWARLLWEFQDNPDPDRHDLENNLTLLRTVPGIQEKDLIAALNLRAAFSLAELPKTQRNKLGLHPTASSTAKFYPLEFWTRLLGLLSQDFEEIEIFCGNNASEREFCERISNSLNDHAFRSTQIFAGLDFKSLVGRIDNCSYFIGSDSALMHLAAMIDRPVLGLWSFANFRLIYPYGNDARVYIPTETISATKHEYPRKAPAYLQRASADTVAKIIQKTLSPDFTIQPAHKKTVGFFEF